jgi:hypothetical protein
MESFFYSYNHAHGRAFQSLGRVVQQKAQAALHAARQHYEERHK